MSPGQIVVPKQGRDKDRPMVVLTVEGDYVYLVDGWLRLLEKPKKKKMKHIQITHDTVNLKPSCGRDLQDADIRKCLQDWE